MNQTLGVFVHCSSCFTRHSTSASQPLIGPPVPVKVPQGFDVALVAMLALSAGLFVASQWPTKN